MLLKVCLPKNTTYYIHQLEIGSVSKQDYWTTVKIVGDQWEFKDLKKALENLIKQVCIKEWNDIRLWKNVYIEMSELRIG